MTCSAHCPTFPQYKVSKFAQVAALRSVKSNCEQPLQNTEIYYQLLLSVLLISIYCVPVMHQMLHCYFSFGLFPQIKSSSFF